MRLCCVSMLIVLASTFFAFGCSWQDKPELDASQYGKVTDTLPEVEGKKEAFQLPEAVESGECITAEQVRKERATEAKTNKK
ncbi:MAG: hypothetical protein PHQ75_13085 [Thermoguttaceae bacterium]|nr:hypothetical protein [Thermoguttaceae bacterium]